MSRSTRTHLSRCPRRGGGRGACTTDGDPRVPCCPTRWKTQTRCTTVNYGRARIRGSTRIPLWCTYSRGTSPGRTRRTRFRVRARSPAEFASHLLTSNFQNGACARAPSSGESGRDVFTGIRARVSSRLIEIKKVNSRIRRIFSAIPGDSSPSSRTSRRSNRGRTNDAPGHPCGHVILFTKGNCSFAIVWKLRVMIESSWVSSRLLTWNVVYVAH